MSESQKLGLFPLKFYKFERKQSKTYKIVYLFCQTSAAFSISEVNREQMNVLSWEKLVQKLVIGPVPSPRLWFLGNAFTNFLALLKLCDKWTDSTVFNLLCHLLSDVEDIGVYHWQSDRYWQHWDNRKRDCRIGYQLNK